MRIVLAGALDTKAEEYLFVAELLRDAGLTPVLVDVGTRGSATVTPDVTREEVASLARVNLARTAESRSAVLGAMGEGLARYVHRQAAEGPVGLFGMGGSGAVTLLSAALRTLPLGSPKVLVTTMVDSAAAALAGTDTLVVPSVVDISGLNSFSRGQLRRAVAYLAAQSRHPVPEVSAAPLVAMTMFGVTTRAATSARQLLEAAGCDVLVFHANGVGGRTLEVLAQAGRLDGVLDLTTTELADDLLGGKASAGPTRLTAAGARGVPQVVSVGALDMANFGPVTEVPPHVAAGRQLYEHGPVDTLVRTSAEDCALLGARLAERVREARGAAVVVLPVGGISALSSAGAAFECAAADRALEAAVRSGLAGSAVPVEQLPMPLDTEAFGRECAVRLLEIMDGTFKKHLPYKS